MTMLFWDALLATVTQALPRVFLFGAPVLLVAIAMAAFVDATAPWHTDQPAPIRLRSGK